MTFFWWQYIVFLNWMFKLYRFDSWEYCTGDIQWLYVEHLSPVGDFSDPRYLDQWTIRPQWESLQYGWSDLVRSVEFIYTMETEWGFSRFQGGHWESGWIIWKTGFTHLKNSAVAGWFPAGALPLNFCCWHVRPSDITLRSHKVIPIQDTVYSLAIKRDNWNSPNDRWCWPETSI